MRTLVLPRACWIEVFDGVQQIGKLDNCAGHIPHFPADKTDLFFDADRKSRVLTFTVQTVMCAFK